MMTSSYSSTSSYRLTFSQLSIEKQITSCFLKTYYITENYYNSRIINDIIYNEKSHIVSLFKDNLIIDDCSEFLKRYYTTDESQLRLPRFFEYHETYSRIYPNYTAIPESKYIYKNIHKKQKIIDQQQNMEMSVEKKNHKRKGKDSKCNNNNNNNYDKQVFSTEVCYSLANDSSLMRSIFGLAKKRRKHSCNNKIINSEYDNNNGNTSVNEVEKLISIIDKHQRAVNVHGNGNGNGSTKHKKNFSSCNHRHSSSNNNNNNSGSNYTSSTTRGKQPIHGLSKIYTDSLGNTITTHNNKYNTIITSSHQITLSNHNINEHNTNTILNYNNNTYKIAQNQHTTRLPTKHITTLSKDIHKKVNELHLPKSSNATSNNSLINHTHRKTNSAYNASCCCCCSTKEKIKVNTASAKAAFEAESIKNRIKRLSSKNNNSNNNGKITYRNRIIPNKNNTLGVRTTNNSLNSYNKTNQTHCSTIKSNKHLPIKNSTIYTTTSHIIKRLIPQSSKNRTGSTSCKRKNGSGAKTERIVTNNNNNVSECRHQQQQQQNAFEIALLKQIIAKTKSNSQTKGNNNNNEYKPILSARGSSSIIGRINNNNNNSSNNSNSKHKRSKHISSTNSNSNSKQGINNKIIKSNNEKKISVNTLNKNTYHYKSSNTSQKNILTPNTIHDEHTTQHNNKHTNIVKGIQIKNFNKVIALASSSTDHKTIDNNYSDNSRSNSNNNKAINVNIKTANTKYLSQTTRNIHHRRSDA